MYPEHWVRHTFKWVLLALDAALNNMFASIIVKGCMCVAVLIALLAWLILHSHTWQLIVMVDQNMWRQPVSMVHHAV
jgi:membrane protein implicated in regulation of membrane protease activity